MGRRRDFGLRGAVKRTTKEVTPIVASSRQAGTPVPTLFLVYETFFDPRFSATTNLLNAQCYAVVQPSVTLEIGYPG